MCQNFGRQVFFKLKNAHSVHFTVFGYLDSNLRAKNLSESSEIGWTDVRSLHAYPSVFTLLPYRRFYELWVDSPLKCNISVNFKSCKLKNGEDCISFKSLYFRPESRSNRKMKNSVFVLFQGQGCPELSPKSRFQLQHRWRT